MPSFSDLMSTPVNELEMPPPLPVGNYVFLITAYEIGESSNKGTPFVGFTLRPLQALDDVDQEALAAIPDWRSRELRGMSIAHFYFPKDNAEAAQRSAYRCRKFVEKAIGPITAPLDQAVTQVMNHQIVGTVGVQINQNDPDVLENNIKAWAKAV